MFWIRQLIMDVAVLVWAPRSQTSTFAEFAPNHQKTRWYESDPPPLTTYRAFIGSFANAPEAALLSLVLRFKNSVMVSGSSCGYNERHFDER